MAARWNERYLGGSPQAEHRVFETLATEILKLQYKVKRRTKAPSVDRAFHAKTILGVEHATLRFADDLPEDLRVGFAQPGQSHRVTVRFSNAHATIRPDPVPDLRGVSLRVHVSNAEQHDLMLVNCPVALARDAVQYVTFASARAGNRLDRFFGLFRLVYRLGSREAWRMLRGERSNRGRTVASLALETYWGHGAIRWGEQAVRYFLRPVPEVAPASVAAPVGLDYLRHDLARRLKDGEVAFDLYLQRFVDETSTPIEDPTVEWTSARSAPVRVARLTIAQQDVSSLEARTAERRVNELAFNSWNTTDEFRPLGNLNRARKAVYDASSAHRLGLRWYTHVPLSNRVFGAILRAFFWLVNRRWEWHQLPLRMSLLNLDALRYVLRRDNLIDMEPVEAPPQPRTVPPPPSETVRMTRSHDGSFNDLSSPRMGAVGACFGRNMPPIYRPDLFNEPNPYEVSEQLLARKTFIPAGSLNILAAAWIQFQVHDWVSHERFALGKRDDIVPLPPGKLWRSHKDDPPSNEMRIAGEVPHKDADPAQPILFANTVSHWWDGSEVYGCDPNAANALRERCQGGYAAELRLESGYLPEEVKGFEVTGFNLSWWLGLSAMHTLFAREHNLLCGELRRQYRTWSEERIYQTARLIVSALIAKIHTVEWTPAILNTEAIHYALNANWKGPPANDLLTRAFLTLVDKHAKKGIPETVPDHHAAPYSLTEDFTTVYRMHPLLPDDYQLFSHKDGSLIASKGFLDIQGEKTDEVMRKVKLENVLYSFGVAHPGAIVLHNFPRALRQFKRENDEIIDLAVVDLMRSRRRGVPRYNDFRAGLHMKRITRWEDITADPESVRLLKEVYRGDIDLVDTMVGLFAETPPTNFGFSDTAFRIFLLMATRRLQSDRFLTVDFRPEVYSPFGMDWIEKNNMSSLILRHCPELARALPRTGSAFAPWRTVGPA